jgi:hypothetical protein
MSLLSRFARSKDPEVAVAETPVACAHKGLAPRWDNAADMGKKDKITSYACTGCQQSFSPEEAVRLGAE